jgi:hypothetical protein
MSKNTLRDDEYVLGLQNVVWADMKLLPAPLEQALDTQFGLGRKPRHPPATVKALATVVSRSTGSGPAD